MSKSSVDDLVEAGSEYHAGFVTDVESETLPPGLDESVVRFISARKDEPQWLTDWRLKPSPNGERCANNWRTFTIRPSTFRLFLTTPHPRSDRWS